MTAGYPLLDYRLTHKTIYLKICFVLDTMSIVSQGHSHTYVYLVKAFRMQLIQN